MTRLATDWTGSAAQRKPQGTCRPPQTSPEATQDVIPAGTKVFVNTHLSRQWRPHRTKEDVVITHVVKRTHKTITCKHLGWYIRVFRDKIQRKSGHIG